jgi:ferric-dicitrate binding protein FerR (iron transport regulator)
VEKSFEHIDEIIAKFLAGEANAEEIALLHEWKNISEENQKEFLQFSKLYDASASLKEQIPVDTDAAWMHVKDVIAPHKAGKVIPIKKRNLRAPLLRIAAMLLIVGGIAVSLYLLSLSRNEKMVAIDSTNVIRSEVLPDGSTITLNKNSTLSYSSKSFGKKRLTHLKGEAYFDVKHDDSNPFVIEAANLIIQDVGTSFNVKAYEGAEWVVVSVISGEVKVTTVNEENLLLSAGDEVTYNTVSHALSKTEKTDPNISAYANRVFIFENAELKTVINVLNEVYDVRLKTENDSLLACRITVTFDNESIDQITDVIAETLGLELIKEKNTIIFKGNACKE